MPASLLRNIVLLNKSVELAFMETSAKDGTHVKLAFERMINEIFKIAVKPIVKEPESKVTELAKGTKVDTEDEPEAQVRPKKGVKLKSKANQGGKRGCC